MMKRPKRIDFTVEEIEALIQRIESNCITTDDCPLLADLVRAVIGLVAQLPLRTKRSKSRQSSLPKQ